MPALVAGIHVLIARSKTKTWMAGTSPAMTKCWFDPNSLARLALQDVVQPRPQFRRQIRACRHHLREVYVAVEAHDHAGEAVFRYTRVRVLQDRALDCRVAAFQETIGDRLAELRAGRDPCQDAVLDALPVCDLDKHFIRQRCRSLEHGSANLQVGMISEACQHFR